LGYGLFKVNQLILKGGSRVLPNLFRASSGLLPGYVEFFNSELKRMNFEVIGTVRLSQPVPVFFSNQNKNSVDYSKKK
jgi:hypothetical protein